MFHKVAGLVRVTQVIAILATVFLLATSGSPPASALTQAAYQGAPATSASISNAPLFKYGSCVPVHVAIRSDAGTPKGTVQFSVDGVVVDTRALPPGGSFTEMIGCCGSRISAPLSVGTHHFAVTFIPSGNWAPSHATGQVVIVPAGNGSHPVCGGTVTSGLPIGVDAGLSTFGSHAGDNSTLRMIVSGMAVTLAMGVVVVYRRRRVSRPVRIRD